MKNNFKIIVVGSTHHNTLGMMRCIGMAGLRADLILIDRRLSYVARSKYVDDISLINNENKIVDLLLSKYSECKSKIIILPCSDKSASILDENYDLLKNRFIFPNAGEQGRLTRFMNKHLQSELARESGLSTPQIFNLYNILRYPCLLKPSESINGGKNIQICHDEHQLREAIKCFKDNTALLAQEFIQKDGEVVLLGLSVNGQVIIPGVVIKHRDFKGATLYSEVKSADIIDSSLIDSAKNLIAKMGYEGLFGVEFVRKEDRYFFIEVNLRADATTYSLAIAGVNLPQLYISAIAEGREIPETFHVSDIRSIVEFNDLKHRKDNGRIPLRKWLKEYLSAECKYYFNISDLKPFLYAVLGRRKAGKAKYLIRLDDACPNMKRSNWQRMESMLDRYGIKPLVGIIPANADENLMIDPVDPDIWGTVKKWVDKGWSIAMHGYNHLHTSTDSGINPLWPRSEFAGLPLEEQKMKIGEGLKIFQSHGVTPRYFFAPSHTFDLNTLRALKESSEIRIISDTIACRPYRDGDFVFIPQFGGRCRNIPLSGVWTFCLHPSMMSEEDFKALERFLSKHASKFLPGFNDLNLTPTTLKPKSPLDKLLSRTYFLLRHLR